MAYYGSKMISNEVVIVTVIIHNGSVEQMNYREEKDTHVLNNF